MRKHLKYLRKEKGMTLVELLAVLVILGIVAAIAVPLIGNIINDSKEKAILADAQQILSAAKLAHANGEGTGKGTADSPKIFDHTILSEYVDGNANIKAGDEVTFNGSTWEVTYKELTKLDNKGKYKDASKGTINEKTLSKLLSGDSDSGSAGGDSGGDAGGGGQE